MTSLVTAVHAMAVGRWRRFWKNEPALAGLTPPATAAETTGCRLEGASGGPLAEVVRATDMLRPIRRLFGTSSMAEGNTPREANQTARLRLHQMSSVSVYVGQSRDI